MTRLLLFAAIAVSLEILFRKTVGAKKRTEYLPFLLVCLFLAIGITLMIASR